MAVHSPDSLWNSRRNWQFVSFDLSSSQASDQVMATLNAHQLFDRQRGNVALGHGKGDARVQLKLFKKKKEREREREMGEKWGQSTTPVKNVLKNKKKKKKKKTKSKVKEKEE